MNTTAARDASLRIHGACAGCTARGLAPGHAFNIKLGTLRLVTRLAWLELTHRTRSTLKGLQVSY